MKKALKYVLILTGSIVAVFLVCRYGWMLFGFNMCIAPTGLYAQEVTVSEHDVHLRGDTTHSAPAYVGYIYKIEKDSLYIGLKYNMLFGFFTRRGTFDVSIYCDTNQFSRIYFSNGAEEELIWQSSDAQYFVPNIAIEDRSIEITEEIPSYSRIATDTLQISADFKEGDLPYTQGRREIREEAERWKEIGVVIENDTMIAVERREIDYGELRVESGTIVGTDFGEFGGDIRFKPSSGAEYIILNENFIGFYVVGEKRYVITGLAHMSTDCGGVYELRLIDDRWQAKTALDIGSQPMAFLVVNEDLFVITDDALLQITHSDAGVTADVLIDNAFWSGDFPFSDEGHIYSAPLAPTSMIYANHSIYLGMYGGAYMYDLDTHTDQWYDYFPERR